jgi:hypothetical protein
MHFPAAAANAYPRWDIVAAADAYPRRPRRSISLPAPPQIHIPAAIDPIPASIASRLHWSWPPYDRSLKKGKKLKTGKNRKTK